MKLTKTMRFVLCNCAVLVLVACGEESTENDPVVPNTDAGLSDVGGSDVDVDGGSDVGDADTESDADGEVGEDGGSDGAAECEVALDCALACDPDEACALECGETGLDSERKAAFEALISCMAEAGCGFNDPCLDASCEAEFRVFDGLCT